MTNVVGYRITVLILIGSIKVFEVSPTEAFIKTLGKLISTSNP